jgi:hypothetical protein
MTVFSGLFRIAQWMLIAGNSTTGVDGALTANDGAAMRPFHKPISAGFCASALTYLCFLTWVHSKAASRAEEQGTTGLIAIADSQAYVLHLPGFWALAIIAFGVGFFLFRDG